MKYYLGIDGGGTKTTAVICDENCNFISSFVGESINFNSVGTKTARENLRAIADGVTQGGNIRPDAVFIGMSAISERADDALTKELCDDIFDCGNITMDSDVFIGIEAMRCDGAAAMVISGTGSMAAGRLADGEIIHTGGWGYILGDEGSGYAMALDAIKAGICASEGSSQPTSLTQAVLDHFKISDMQELIDIFNGYIAAMGKEYGVPTPVNTKLTEMIHEIERKERPITPDNLDEFKGILFK